MNEELRKKLAKWAGFWQGTHTVYSWKPKWDKGDRFWRYPTDSFQHKNLPDFPESLDAVFEWLVPKAVAYLMGQKTYDRLSAVEYLFKRWLEEYTQCLDFALALSRVIEQLIDRGE